MGGYYNKEIMVQIQGTQCGSHRWVHFKYRWSCPWAYSEGMWGEQRYFSTHF